MSEEFTPPKGKRGWFFYLTVGGIIIGIILSVWTFCNSIFSQSSPTTGIANNYGINTGNMTGINYGTMTSNIYTDESTRFLYVPEYLNQPNSDQKHMPLHSRFDIYEGTSSSTLKFPVHSAFFSRNSPAKCTHPSPGPANNGIDFFATFPLIELNGMFVLEEVIDCYSNTPIVDNGSLFILDTTMGQ
jgi:hypothetical protein